MIYFSKQKLDFLRGTFLENASIDPNSSNLLRWIYKYLCNDIIVFCIVPSKILDYRFWLYLSAASQQGAMPKLQIPKSQLVTLMGQDIPYTIGNNNFIEKALCFEPGFIYELFTKIKKLNAFQYMD